MVKSSVASVSSCSILGAIVLFAAVDLFAADISPAERIVFLDGTRTAGKLTAFLPEGKLEFEMRTIAASELTQYGARREALRGPCLLLTDGSLVAAKGDPDTDDVRHRWVRLSAAEAVVDSFSLGASADPLVPAQLKVSVDRVRAVAFQLPAAARERDQLFDRLSDPHGDEDRIYLENGDVVVGTLHLPEELPEAPRAKDTAEGAPFLIDTRVGNRMQRVEVAATRVAAVRFNPTLLNVPEPVKQSLEIGLRDGSFLRTTAIGPVGADGAIAAVELAGELKLPVSPFADLAAETVFLRARSERITYLTDLAPAAYRHWPFLTTERPLARGTNVLGGRLRAGGAPEEQGLGMHSRARAIYTVPPGAKRFETEAALDDAAGGKGSVVFRVLKLSGTAWSVAAESALVRGGDPAVSLAVDLAEAEQIALVVEFGDRGDECDWADWLGARFVK